MTFAGEIVTAAEFNDMAEVGEELLEVTATSDSSSWNSATKVLTNLTGTVTTVEGAKYKIAVNAGVENSAGGYATIGVVYKQGGAAVATDTLAGSRTTHTPTAGALWEICCEGTFTSTADGTYGVACVGWVALGAATFNLGGDASHSINRLTVTRVRKD